MAVNGLKQRVHRLNCLKRLFIHMQSQIMYTAAPLEELIVSEDNEISREIRKNLNSGKDIIESWKTAAQSVYSDKSDRELMVNFISDFGKCDASGQYESIGSYVEHLNIQIEEAGNALREKGRVKFAASSFFGVAAAIILI